MRKYILLISSLFFSCQELFVPETEDNTPINNFNLCWSIVDKNYCFFEYKNVDWVKVYNKYRPQISERINNDSLFNILQNMLRELKDGHVNVYNSYDYGRYWDWFEKYPSNFDFEVIKKSYIGNKYKICSGFITNKIINQDIGYFYFGDFSDAVSTDAFDLYLGRYYKSKGIILDFRNNGGGLISNVEKVASRFISDSKVVGYIRYKNGSGHNDLTKAYERNFSHEGVLYPVKKPIIVLTNRKIFSAANDVIAVLKTIDNVIVVGDTTGGGGGMPITNQLLNGWSIRYSAHQFLTPQMQQIEYGIAPHFYNKMDKLRRFDGYDSILDTAIIIINNYK